MPVPEVPYAASRDNVVTFVVVVCFVVMVVSVARSRRFVARQMRSFFYPTNRLTTEWSETSGEVGFQLLLNVLTCAVVSLLLYIYVGSKGTDAGAPPTDNYRLLGGCFLLLVAFSALRLLLYNLTGWVFFERLANNIWLKSQLFLWGMAGLALYPVVLLVVYFNLPSQLSVSIMLGVAAAVEALTFYKSYILFFRQKRMWIQNVVYLCSLEAVPLLLLYATMAWMRA